MITSLCPPGKTAASWLILADDLTGAADCAIAFARQGMQAVVGWSDAAGGPRPAVFSYNADSRGLDADAVRRRHRGVLERLLEPDRRLFVKIDSTLRGQPAAAIAAALAVRPVGILAPAFPATGRTTRDGRVMVDGKPLEQAEVWRRDHTYHSADLVSMLATAGVSGVRLPRVDTDALHDAIAALPHGHVAVCDAMTQDDLDRVAVASLAARQDAFFIGSAGLAHALAALTPGHGDPPVITPRSTGALIVVGSLAAASRAASRDLATMGGVRYVPVAPAALLGRTAGNDIGSLVADGLASGEDVLVELLTDDEPDLSIGPRLAAGLAQMLRPAVPHMSGLAATGGETAAALLEGFGVTAIRLLDELEPGVSFGLTVGDVAVPIVTKAGAFGDHGSLVRIVRRLRLLRQQGSAT